MVKFKRMKKFALYLLLLMPLFGACKAVKDDFGIANPAQYSRIYLAAAYNGMQQYGLQAPKPAEIKVFANYSGVLPLAADVNVTLTADLSLVAKYNSVNGTSFKAMPTAAFSMLSSNSQIPAGATTASEPAVVNIITTAFQDDSLYLLPIRITSVSDPSLTINSDLETLYLGVACTGSSLYITANPLLDYTVSSTENW